MSSQLSQYLNGSEVIIKIGDRTLAYGSSLSFNEDFSNQVIGALGSSGPLALEPVSTQGGSGSFTITRYAVDDAPALGATRPKLANKAGSSVKDNSFFSPNSFSPARIILDSTFDIIVVSKSGLKGTSVADVYEYKLIDCLLSGYDISFSAGGISSENYSFECRLVVDPGSEPLKEAANR